MVGPTKKALSKKAYNFPKADGNEAPSNVNKRKDESALVKDATEAQASTVETRASTTTNLDSPSSVSMKKPKQAKKDKAVRDSFKMAKSDHDKIAALKLKCAESGVTVKKNELLRAGLLILMTATAEQLVAAVGAVETDVTDAPEKTSF